jgi:KDO2-lipid IV(A) lauroyltransferase
MIRVEGLEHLQALKGQPVIALAPHFIGLNFGGIRVAHEWPGSASIYSRQKNPVLDRLFWRARTRFGDPVLVSRQEGLRAVVRTIRSGHSFYFLPDMDFGARDAIFVPFFGVPTATDHGAAAAREAHAREGDPGDHAPGRDGYVVRFYPAVGELSDGRRGGRRAPHERVHRGARPRDAGAVFLGAQALQDAPAGRALALRRKAP